MHEMQSFHVAVVVCSLSELVHAGRFTNRANLLQLFHFSHFMRCAHAKHFIGACKSFRAPHAFISLNAQRACTSCITFGHFAHVMHSIRLCGISQFSRYMHVGHLVSCIHFVSSITVRNVIPFSVQAMRLGRLMHAIAVAPLSARIRSIHTFHELQSCHSFQPVHSNHSFHFMRSNAVPSFQSFRALKFQFVQSCMSSIDLFHRCNVMQCMHLSRPDHACR